jgi:hypothetical protein
MKQASYRIEIPQREQTDNRIYAESARACRRALVASVAVSAMLGCVRAWTVPTGGAQAVDRWSNVSTRWPVSAWADSFARMPAKSSVAPENRSVVARPPAH